MSPTRMHVEPDEVVGAALRFGEAADLAAGAAARLDRALAGQGAMAGDDATSEAFAATYDRAAREGVAALAALVGGLTGLAALVRHTGEHHRRAEHTAAAGFGRGLGATATPRAETPPHRPGPTRPPSVIGPAAADRPPLWDVVADHLEGWAWPGADTHRLRAVARAWQEVAHQLGSTVATDLRLGLEVLCEQEAPDLSLAADVVAGLVTDVVRLAEHCASLGEACERYAEHVDEVRATVRGIVGDLALEVGLSVATGVVLGLFSAGVGAGGGAALAGTRIAAAARRIVAALRRLRDLGRTVALGRLRPAADELPHLAARFERFHIPANRAVHERYVDGLRAAMAKPKVRDPALARYMERIFRGPGEIGNGSTGAAVRHELATGARVKDRQHVQKAGDMAVALERWLARHPDATRSDRAAAENVLRDLRNALEGR